MRWTKPDNGEVRVVKRFLFFPKTLFNPISEKNETRWFEFASINQRYNGFSICGSSYLDGWINISWHMKWFNNYEDKETVCIECTSLMRRKGDYYVCEECGAESE